MVLGKGGVGRSTVAAALSMTLAHAGRRVLVAEVAAQERLPELFRGPGGDPIGYDPTPVFPGVDVISIDPLKALKEYLSLMLPMNLGGLLFEHGAFSGFAAAAPGLREMVTMGKLWYALEERAAHGSRPRWDVVVVDAPATGHGLGLLATPRTFTGLARTGKVHGQAVAIAELVADHDRTCAVLVARPEELPVTEAGEAADALRHRLGVRLSLVVANGVLEDRFDDRSRAALAVLARGDGLEPAARAAVAAGARRVARRDVQEAEVARLGRVTGVRPIELPLVEGPQFGPRELAVLAGGLEPACR